VDKARGPVLPTGHGAAARRIHHAARRAEWWMRFAYPPWEIVFRKSPYCWTNPAGWQGFFE
jgi:hypothetical protein